MSSRAGFPTARAYEKQARRGLVACPECGSTRVDKAIMAPAVVGAARATPPVEAPAEVALLDERQRALRELMRALRREIEANTDDVGAKFPEVARAIHAGDEPERAIRGQATLAEVEGADRGGRRRAADADAADEFN